MTKNCINFIVVRRKCLFNCFPHLGAVTCSIFYQPTIIFRFEFYFSSLLAQFLNFRYICQWYCVVILLSLFPVVISITPNFEEFVCKPLCLFPLHTLWFYRRVVVYTSLNQNGAGAVALRLSRWLHLSALRIIFGRWTYLSCRNKTSDLVLCPFFGINLSVNVSLHPVDGAWRLRCGLVICLLRRVQVVIAKALYNKVTD